MRRSSGDARIAETAEDAKLVIRRQCTEEEMMRSEVAAGATWADIKKESGCGECVGPETRRHVGVKEEGANAVIESAEDTFGATILLRSVWACEAKGGAMSGEESANSEVVELLPVVCLQRKNGTTKLRGDIGIKRGKSGESIGLAAQRKGPHIMGEIIEDDKVISIARITCNWRGPNITMD
jgi:hypothetical protein